MIKRYFDTTYAIFCSRAVEALISIIIITLIGCKGDTGPIGPVAARVALLM